MFPDESVVGINLNHSFPVGHCLNGILLYVGSSVLKGYAVGNERMRG